MNEPHLIHLASLADLRAAAEAWDDLWQRSDVTFPMARAELVAQWVERFTPKARFRALVVEEAGTWVAALPLIEISVLRLARAGTMPLNSWVPGGRLLVDPSCHVERALDRLAAGVLQSPWQVLWLNTVPLDTAPWQALPAAFARAGMPSSVLDRYEVGWIDIDGDWHAFTRRWSKKSRETISRAARRLADLGEVRYESHASLDSRTLEAQLRRGFEVEDRSWKGRSGTSVLRSGLFPFFLQQARQLAQWGCLHLAFLESSRRTIAFAYGAAAKGVYHGCKMGYDQEYARYGPGNLLAHNLFRELWDDPCCRAVDFLGPMTETHRHWKPASYRVGRVVVGSPHLLGRALVYSHEYGWPHLRRLRRYLAGRPGSSARAAAVPQGKEPVS